MSSSLFTLFNQDTTILTPNQRLSARLLKEYHCYQSQQGETCWLSLDLLPLSSWISRLWDNYVSAEMDGQLLVLNTAQELILWEELISKAPESEYLLKLSELAKQAKSAWSTLKKWRTDFNHASFSLTENCRAFQGWAQAFANRCQQENWIDSASLTDLIIKKIQAQKISLPQQLILVNFAEITPQQTALLKACETQGTTILHHHLAENAKTPQLPAQQIMLTDEEDEIQTMACWAKKILEQQPDATIGCIASALEEKRDMIIAIFTAVLGQENLFNISAGKVLAAYPIIQHAFQLLLLPLKTVSIETFSIILHSPYLGDADKEMLQRVQTDSYLRKKNINSLTWETLWKINNSLSHSRLATRIKNFLQLRDQQPTQQTISQWIHHFAQALESLGWPGEQSLNSAEYQVVHCWLSLLKETATLDNILPLISYNKALHYLTVLAAQTFFQPQTPEAPIQILGQLEGAGIPFDYLWITGMTDKAWPPAPKPSPFIPHDLQKRLHMPNASAARQLEYSLKLTEQFKQAAPTVLFSYSQHQDQEELRGSPLLADLSAITIDELHLAPFLSLSQTIFASQALEQFQDEQALPLPANHPMSGGTSIFEMQAACPFKAFAKLRLHARTIEELEPGLPAKSRGSIVHRVLELFWQEVGNQSRLLQLDQNDLALKIKQHLTSALSELAPFLQQGSIYLSLVIERLSKLLEAWLALEKTRPPFKVIAQEAEKILTINHSELKLRVDRIDELADGSKLIIDYKTKKSCDIQDWFGERPTEPQLPLYCISSPDYAEGIAFGQLHASKVQLKGLAQKDLGIAGIKTFNEKSPTDASSWEGQLEQWRITLTQLFEDFHRGQAEVNPKDKQSCQYCDLQSLCRIDELNHCREASEN